MKLRPCPFCGSEAAVVFKARGWAAHCLGRFKNCPVNGRTRYCQTAELAAQLWDTRA